MTTVVKVGGSLEVGEAGPLLDELAACPGGLVVVHGAHLQLDRLAVALGHPPRMVTSTRGEVTRYTDRETMDHFLMAYCGLANKRLVEALRARGADAVGLAAMDGGIATGRRKPDLRIAEGGRQRLLHDNHAGTLERVDVSLLRLLLDSGRLPVLTPPAISDRGEAINVDGDRLAAELAVALGARRLVILMNVPGLLRDPAGEFEPRCAPRPRRDRGPPPPGAGPGPGQAAGGPARAGGWGDRGRPRHWTRRAPPRPGVGRRRHLDRRAGAPAPRPLTRKRQDCRQ